MYGNGPHGLRYQEESEEEYDVFAEAEKDRVVKTFSKESANTRIQWNTRRDQDQLDRYRELAIVDSTENPGTSTKATQNGLQRRTSRLNNGQAGGLFSSIASSIVSQQDTSARMDMKSAPSYAGIFSSVSSGLSNKIFKDVEMGPSHKRMDVEDVASHFTIESGKDKELRSQHLKKSAFDRTIN